MSLKSSYLEAVIHKQLLIFFYGMDKKESNLDIQRLAKRIKNLREERGYSSYEKFAFEKDIHRAQYWRYEKGEDLKFTSLIKVVRAFDMTLEEFFSSGFD